MSELSPKIQTLLLFLLLLPEGLTTQVHAVPHHFLINTLLKKHYGYFVLMLSCHSFQWHR